MNEKKSAFKIVWAALNYFYPIAWKHYKGFFLFGMLKIIIYTLKPFVAIIVMPLIIDELLGDKDIQRLILCTAIIVIGETVLSLMGSIVDVTLEKYGEKMTNFFEEEMSRRVMELDFQLTEDKTALDQIEAASTGMSWYSGGVHGISMQLFGIITCIFTIVGTVTLILMNAPVLFVVTAVLLMIYAAANSKENRIDMKAFEMLSKINRIFGYLGYGITDFRYGKDIRLYHARDMMLQKWEKYSDDSLKTWKWQADRKLLPEFTKTIAHVLRNFIIYLYLGVLVITEKITIGIFSQMLSSSSVFYTSVEGLVFYIQDIIKRTNYAYEYVKFMNYPAAIEKGDRHIETGEHIIEFRDVSFCYPGTTTKILNHINLVLHPGEHLSIVGLNGAGKTTFVKLLCRLYDPVEGEILLDGVNIKEYDYSEYMSLFAPVFQDFKLFAFSIRENIILSRTVNEAEIRKITDQVGLFEKIDSLTEGIDTMLFKGFDENGIEPSGGEQQKIAIARALLKKAPVVILDEPTAALDPIAEYDIYRQFDVLVGNKTAIYISHRLSSCRFCDRIAVFSEGKIMEYGTHNELVDKVDGIYAKMFEAQAQYYK
ncbi:MAG: ABC transporter ATP-binding protein [Lachnospiraceae bacterium]|nr:ABC transporter ATP-binding protein [Lachnospiraceae bacterium]